MRGSGNNSKPLTESDRIKQLLIRVGDDGPNFYKRDIDKLSSNLDAYYQKSDQAAKDSVVELLAECIGSLPHKASIYATTAALISQQNPSLPDVLIDKVLEKLRKGIDRGDVYAPRSIMIYLGELMNIGVINHFLFFNMLFDLFSAAEKSLKTSHDYYLYIGISVMVYVMDHLKEKSTMELNSLVKTINDLMLRKERNYLTVLRIRKDQASLNTRLDILWNAVKAHIESGKKSDLSLLARPYEQYTAELAGVKELKKNIKIQFTPKDPKTVCFYQSAHYGLLFEESLLRQEVSSTVDLSILQEKIADALTIFSTAKKFALQQLLQINDTYNCPRLIIQAVLAEMFNLPTPPSKLIFYSSVIVSFINDSPEPKRENIKKIIQEAAHTLLTQGAHHDVEILDRFLDWLPHFISNFNFEWDWSGWKYIADSDPASPEAVLFRNLIRKLVQISFIDRVKEALPEELRVFLPSEEVTSFEYENPEGPNGQDAQTIREKMNTKPAAQEMTEFLKSGDNNIEAKGELLLDVFVQCLLTRCSLTVTHFNANIEKFHSTVSQMMSKESDQLVVLDAVRKFYRNSNFHVLLTINGMETFKILDSKNIVNWLFTSIEKEEDINNYFQLYWDLLFLITTKNATNIHVLQQNISGVDGRDKIPNAQSELEDARNEQQTIFSLIFKHLQHLIGEVYNSNEEISRVLVNRLVEIARRYRNELIDTFPQIEEDFSSINKGEIDDALRQVRELAVNK